MSLCGKTQRLRFYGKSAAAVVAAASVVIAAAAAANQDDKNYYPKTVVASESVTETAHTYTSLTNDVGTLCRADLRS